MREFYPVLIVGVVIGVLSAIFAFAFFTVKDRKESMGFERNMKDGELIRRMWKYVKPYTGSFVLVFFLLIVSIAYDVISPMLVGYIEELLKTVFPLSRLFALVAVYAGILIVSMICTYAQTVLLQRVGQKIVSGIREELFIHIESLSHDQLSKIPVGTLVTRVSNDPGALSMMFTNVLANLVKNALVIIGITAAMFCLNVALSLMVLCFVPFIVFFTMIFRKFSRRAFRKVKNGNTAINTFLSENLSGMKIIQIFNREERKKAEFDKKNGELRRAMREQMLVFGIFRPTVYMLYISSILCLLYVGGRGYIKDTPFLGQTITSGIVVSFYMYITKFFTPIQNLAEQFNMLQSAFASAEKIFTVFDIRPEIVDAEDAVELGKVEGRIEFRHVWFAYKPEQWVLKDVSFTVEPGQTVAFVGATGSGKTTILSLICRNYEVQKGEILIDGIDVKKIKLSSLRAHFGQMLQDVFLFSGTVRSNILLRKENISDEDVMEACRYVNADHFIGKLENGLDEEVIERGANFSAGQRQLLSFARTVIHKPEIMILDEATANIDTETEILIQNSLEKMMNIGTMLMVAHRLSTIRHADKIIVLNKGVILEQGGHAELLEKKGRYFELYMMSQDTGITE